MSFWDVLYGRDQPVIGMSPMVGLLTHHFAIGEKLERILKVMLFG